MSKTDKVREDLKMDMTPMIDCVFLLMIFFVLVIDLSQQDLEALILPEAKYQEPDEDPDPNRPIVNINQRGRVIWKKKLYYDPLTAPQDYEKMLELLLIFKDFLPEKDKEKKVIGNQEITLVNTPVLIRADKWTEWHYIGKLMEQCSNPKAGFWKLELAMSEEDKEEKLFASRQQ